MSTWLPPPPPLPLDPSAAKTRRSRWILAACAIVVIALAMVWSLGRSAYRNYRVASAAVDHFHDQLNREDYDGIYEEASDEFRRFGTRTDDTKFLASVHQKMGNSGAKSPSGFHVNWRNGRTWVDQVYETQFSLGTGRESFIWIIDQNHAQLYGYHIDSTNLK
jgi:hypothetical protein